MADVKDMALAKATFDTLCKTLDHEQWHYKKDEEGLSIECGARGDDLPMELVLKVDPDKMLVLVFSHLPYVVQEDKRLDVAIAVSVVNDRLVDGCFDYDVSSGHMFFRMSNSFIDSTLGQDLMAYLLYCSCQTIDAYNDKFLMLAKGMLSIEQFLTAEAN